MSAFAGLCADTLGMEMALHREQCAEFGVSPADLEALQPAQSTRGYAAHLVHVAATGGPAGAAAVLAPRKGDPAAEVARLEALQGAEINEAKKVLAD